MGNDEAGAPAGGSTSVQTVIEEALQRGNREADPAEVAATDTSLDELMNHVADPPVSVQAVAPAPAPTEIMGVGMRTGVPVAIDGDVVSLTVRGVEGTVTGELAPGVSAEVIALAVQNGDAVLLECAPDMAPLVVGALQTRVPEKLVLKAKKLHIEGEDEVLIRSGLGAVRIRRDGDVELVGSRIAAMSRGLFRLVGRVLRLN